MKFETSSLRRTSESDDVLPWRAGDVTFICVTATGTVTQAKRIEEKRAILDKPGHTGRCRPRRLPPRRLARSMRVRTSS